MEICHRTKCNQATDDLIFRTREYRLNPIEPFSLLFPIKCIALLLIASASLSALDVKDWKLDGTVGTALDIRVQCDVDYLPADKMEKADFYFPLAESESGRHALVLLMHVDGFNDGEKARSREVQMGMEMARHDYTCLGINYKLWSNGIKKQTCPLNLHHAKSAVLWLRKNSERLRIAPDRITALRNSAGGNLALMHATTSPDDELQPTNDAVDDSTRISCAIDFYGAFDMSNSHNMKMFKKARRENPDFYHQASPARHASRGDAPISLMHGTADETVDASRVRNMAAALEKAGVEHELEFIPSALDTLYIVSKESDFRPLIFAFLDKNLKPIQ